MITSATLCLTVTCARRSANFLIQHIPFKNEAVAISCCMRDPQFSATATTSDNARKLTLASFNASQVLILYCLFNQAPGSCGILSHTSVMLPVIGRQRFISGPRDEMFEVLSVEVVLLLNRASYVLLSLHSR